MADDMDATNRSLAKIDASIEARAEAARLQLVTTDGKRILPLVMDYATLEDVAGQLTWVVKHVLPAASVGVMFGASGTFKSFLAIDAAMHIAHGLPWLGQKTQAGDVVYLAAEGGLGILRRVKAWHQQHKLKPHDGRFWFVPRPLDLVAHAATLRKAIEDLQIVPRLIVIDTLSQTYSGEENSSNEMADFLRAVRLDLAQAFGACVLILHHSGHSATERPRGSSAIRANTDFLFGVFRDEKEMAATLENTHQKDGELFRESSFDLHSLQIGTDEDGEAINMLVAIEMGSVEEFCEKLKTESNAGRGGTVKLLNSLCEFGGQTEDELRQAFYKALGNDKTAEAKKKAFQRAKDKLVAARMLDIEANLVVMAPKWVRL